MKTWKSKIRQLVAVVSIISMVFSLTPATATRADEGVKKTNTLN